MRSEIKKIVNGGGFAISFEPMSPTEQTLIECVVELLKGNFRLDWEVLTGGRFQVLAKPKTETPPPGGDGVESAR